MMKSKEKNKVIIIYQTTNHKNDMIYVGRHNSDSDNYLGSGSEFKKAVKEFGKEHFTRETLEYVTEDTWEEREEYWIDKLDARNPKVGYNKTKGGRRYPVMFGEDNPMYEKGYLTSGRNNGFFGKKHSKESKELIGKSSRERYHPKGYKHTEETKKKWSISKIKYYEDPKNKKKNSEALKKYYKDNPEAILKNMNRPNCIKIEIEGKKYQSIRDASRKLKRSRRYIERRLKSGKYNNYTYED